MMFPPKLLQWLQTDPKRAISLSTLHGSVPTWYVTMHETAEKVSAEGTGRLPSEAIIRCWENFLAIQN
jgi:hypothetical protein